MLSSLLSLALAFPLLSAAAADPSLVRAPAGPVVGLTLGQTHFYRGIPYAEAPVGAGRWAPPRPKAPWSEVRSAYRYGAKCPQPGAVGFDGEEDCLTLNVWRPAAAAHPLPVMVFIHGGGNSLGSAAEEVGEVRIYDGRALSESGSVVVVTLNYRLGALGFLAHSALSRAGGYGGSGNYGLMDQLLALRWVQDNIGAFGGDPRHVTLFGESAGAINTLALMASPQADGLFHRAIVQSGFLTELPLPAAEAAGAAFATRAGCTGDDARVARCLRELPLRDLIRAGNSPDGALLAAAALTIDGHILHGPVLERLRQRTLAGRGRPLIIGTNADEMTTLGPAVAKTHEVRTEADFVAAIRQLYAERAKPVLAAYPLADYTSPRHALESLLADAFTHCPTRRVARAVAAPASPVWRYLFTHVPDHPSLARYGASHAFELPYVFRNLSPLLHSAREGELAKEISSFWQNFARTGQAGVSPAGVEWRDVGAQPLFRLDLEMGPLPGGFREAQCDFWDRLETAQ